MIRGITLRGGIALNVITMIGIGPLITIPLVLQKLHGTLALAGWIAGALVALCDGLVWAELGSQYPGAGGTYAYLRDVFGAERWGRLLAFLYNWQYVLSISLIVASGYIGFAQYAAYIYPPIASNFLLQHLVAAGIGIASIALVYRRITDVAKLGGILAVLAIGTLAIVGIAGFSHGSASPAAGSSLSSGATFGWAFAAGLGQALYITLYDYTGYAQVAAVGEEVVDPRRTLARSIVISISIVFAFYLFLQIGVLAGIDWHTLFDSHGNPTPASNYLGSTVVQHSWGHGAAVAVTVLVLITAFASLYGNLVGAARVPFAAARDNAFVPAFARLHPRGGFPHISLLGIGAISIVACFFTLDQVIAALIAAGIIGGSVAQIVALFVLRGRGGRAPFRMPLFPLPALIALAGWVLAFVSTGTSAILLGVLWLAAGIAVYAFMASRQRAWPFAAAAAAAMLLLLPQHAQAAPSRKPAFVYGAAFFYERMPRAQWKPALEAYKKLGINTIDLYVIWNWHELHDGGFDFTGRTNDRRDLVALLKLIHSEGYALILRPGPVIRNEWRNGGYPDWLLSRPEYNMPLRDILEGRYPATATYQNAHSDAAAAEWMANQTHMRYAARWLQRVYALAKPYKDDIVAVALDDDQGAYIDNDTWPGTHFHAYMQWLKSQAQRGLPGVPVFINTYQMKVTASAPVWAWGNWYQSDAYSIGEHDRAQIEFSTGLLQTQSPQRPIMISEFQAGWLQGADETQPRAADPSNTDLALHTFLQMGAHGVVNFPVQDTWNPAGWEAPWANEFYSWDAAYGPALTPSVRFRPTYLFGSVVSAYGAQLAKTHPVADAAIAYTASAYDAKDLTNDDVYAIAAATVAAQTKCRAVRITCALVDLRYNAARLRSYRVAIVPDAGLNLPMLPAIEQTLDAFRRAGGRVVADAAQANVAHPAAAGIPNAVLLLADNERYGFLDIVNYGDTPQAVPRTMLRRGRFSAVVPSVTIAARSGRLLELAPHRSAYTSFIIGGHASAENVLALRTSDGFPHHVLRSGDGTVYDVSACSGARIFSAPLSSIGGARDTWTPELPPSPRDYIAKYTHPISTGTFNRCYRVSNETRQGGTYTYIAPDAPGGPATFTKTIALNGAALDVTTTAAFASSAEQPKQIWSLEKSKPETVLNEPGGLALYDSVSQTVTLVRWSGQSAFLVEPSDTEARFTLTYAQHAPLHVRIGKARAQTEAEAQARFAEFAKAPQP